MAKTFSDFICKWCDKPTVFHNPIADELDQQITQLKADLAEYGGHTADCWVNTLETPGEEHPCDCGWAEIAEGQKNDKNRPKSTQEENQVVLGENVPGTPSSDG